MYTMGAVSHTRWHRLVLPGGSRHGKSASCKAMARTGMERTFIFPVRKPMVGWRWSWVSSTAGKVTRCPSASREKASLALLCWALSLEASNKSQHDRSIKQHLGDENRS